MSTGTIGRLVRDHGFGFIRAADGIDLFFHRSEIEDVSFGSLKEGQEVEFKVSLSPKGLKATKVKLLKK
jgi:CspA family cold shock protein